MQTTGTNPTSHHISHLMLRSENASMWLVRMFFHGDNQFRRPFNIECAAKFVKKWDEEGEYTTFASTDCGQPLNPQNNWFCSRKSNPERPQYMPDTTWRPGSLILVKYNNFTFTPISSSRSGGYLALRVHNKMLITLPSSNDTLFRSANSTKQEQDLRVTVQSYGHKMTCTLH